MYLVALPRSKRDRGVRFEKNRFFEKRIGEPGDRASGDDRRRADFPSIARILSLIARNAPILFQTNCARADRIL
jgi:hypothetical protein